MKRFWNLQGSASCIGGVTGWISVTSWFSGYNWKWFLVSFGIFAVGAVLAKRGIARGYGVVDRVLPVAGAVTNMVGIFALLVPVIIWSSFFGGNRKRRR